jgi:5-methylcytosine-specific restriction endonuclease McrA
MRATSYRVERVPQTFIDYGKGNCVFCGTKLPYRRKKYCCDDHAFSYRTQTAKYEVIYWNDFKRHIIERDKHKCQHCGKKTEFPQVHHVKRVCDGGEIFEEKNCITLCVECHKKEHSKIRRIQRQHHILDTFEGDRATAGLTVP